MVSVAQFYARIMKFAQRAITWYCHEKLKHC